MNNYKKDILANLCYTELVYGRINKKLKLDLSKEEIKSARNLFEYGFDNSKQLHQLFSGQKTLDFEKDPE